jgi:hypothetical protein
VYLSGSQSIATGGGNILLNAKTFDTNNEFNTATSSFTAKSAGYYKIYCALNCTGGTHTYCTAYIKVNNTTTAYGQTASFPSDNRATVEDIVHLNAGDTVAFGMYANGTTTITTGGTSSTYMTIFKLSN